MNPKEQTAITSRCPVEVGRATGFGRRRPYQICAHHVALVDYQRHPKLERFSGVSSERRGPSPPREKVPEGRMRVLATNFRGIKDPHPAFGHPLPAGEGSKPTATANRKTLKGIGEVQSGPSQRLGRA